MLDKIYIYLKLYLNKRNCIYYLISIALVCIICYVNLNLGFDRGYYPIIENEIVDNYFNGLIFYILIVNGLLFSIIYTSGQKNENKLLDNMLAAKYRRTSLFIIKSLSLILLCFTFNSIEIFLIYLFPYICFPYFKITNDLFLLLIYLICYTFFILVMVAMLCKITRSVLASFIGLFIPVVFNMVDTLNEMLVINFKNLCIANSYCLVFFYIIDLIMIGIIYLCNKKLYI